MSSPLKYTCLFGGGAIRGLAYVGAIRALEELNVEFDIIGGSSVGSIFATLLACGYKSYELENLFMKVNFELFRDIHLGFGKGLALSKGEIFVDWLNELITQKNEYKNKEPLTFKDLEQDLIIVTTNLKEFNTQEFSKFETPDFEIAKAIRISSSMPGLMPPYKYQNSELVDGDLQKASPMWRLTKTLENSESRILEFRLEGDCSNEAKNPISFINTIYSCMTNVATDFVTDIYGKNDKYDCIRINTGGIFFADLNLNKDARRKLINSGYEQTMHYFKEILPAKKEKLEKVYTKALMYLKKSYKGLQSGNVEETQWWLGDLFILLCENKEIIDNSIYKEIENLKNRLIDSISTILFFHTRFKGQKTLELEMKAVIDLIDARIADIKLFLQAI
ncbi:patatin-like phospholipase family protein [bacterium]|nr:patatin-like phospholipase family protein [bacterium]